MLKLSFSVPWAIGFLGAATLAIQPAQAASLDLNTWTILGDGNKSLNSATITNAFSGGSDDSTNLNISGNDPIVPVDSLETALGLKPGDLGTSAQEGSGLYTDLTVAAGDVLSFNWLIPVNNVDLQTPASLNQIFAAIGGNIIDLNTPSSFSYNFATAGTFRVGVGVVDLGDTVNSAQLQISNANLTPVPTPAMLPGVIGVGLSMLRKRKQQSAG